MVHFFSRKQQKGAAMVEMAVVIMLFIVLVFGILEFAWMVFEWSKQVEATRAGARYAIVHTPACNIYDAESGPKAPPACTGGPLGDCATAGAVASINCGGQSEGGCPGIVATMQSMMPRITGANVDVTYECAGTGYSEAFRPIVNVTVEASEVQHPLFFGWMIVGAGEGEGGTVTIPAFATTRLGEDLYSH